MQIQRLRTEIQHLRYTAVPICSATVFLSLPALNQTGSVYSAFLTNTLEMFRRLHGFTHLSVPSDVELPAIPADAMCTCVESGSNTPFSFSLAVE